MPEDPLLKVKSGLRKGSWIAVIFLAALFAIGLLQSYFQSVVTRSFSILWFSALAAFVIGDGAVAIWYLVYRYMPRILRFVESMPDRLRDSEYAAWGRHAGLRLVFDNGLLLTVSRNLIGFRLFLDYDGTPLHPTLQEYPSLLRSYRRRKPNLPGRSRRGDAAQNAGNAA